ncbi:MAG: hypothetical protein RLY24_610 [Actinomycetota bacterium]|jgi:hypothetical protein
MNKSLTASIANRMAAAISAAGATPHRVSFPTVGLTAHSRNGQYVTRLGDRWRLPMATMVAPADYLRAVGGDDMVAAAGPGQVLMGETSAELRGAQVGDSIVLRDLRFRMHTFTIGAIVPNVFVDWGDLFITTESAQVLGAMSINRVTATNIVSYSRIISQLKSRGIVIGNTYRLRTSWDRENPDGTLGTSTLKKKLGEFAFRPAGGSAIQIEDKWKLNNILWRHSFADIRLRNNCHKVVAAAIQGALSEIKSRGLQRHVDVANANRYGGCYVGRYNRMAGTFGAPSRHAYGAALDINTTQNYQWAVPKMNCDVVRIFRKWGFAWGGNFWPSDGMHFEYVGERRDNIGYPSQYCPNSVPVPTTTLPTFTSGTTTSTTTTSSSSSTTTTTTTVAPITSTT